MERTSSSEEVIFNEAAQIESAEQRAAYLERACGDDHRLREAVEALLRHDAEGDPFLDTPAALAGRAGGTPPVNEGPGSVIGRYKLLQQIGEGGFGVVYMAEQQEPVQRRVALKIIKAGMDTRAVIARFEAERQALAMMDHPNIARVLDAGGTGAGRPFFVMELVKGIPITDYCDQTSLDTRQRLELFKDICSAVQHAHQKGVIHRDLKPSNIMVTLHDGKPVVKVIDFGIAKATERKLTERTLFTQYGQMIGTPAYMSPEQAVMGGLDIDTRTDVYSLGVLLYELLTGAPPFDAQTLRSAGFDEMRRIIREQEPPKPSTKLSTLAEDVMLSIAAKRHVTPAALSRQLRGDLDWVVMKALEKDRSRRYESASALARDIERHLGAEPVEAAAPSTVYRLRKFVRRNKGPLTAVAMVALLLVSGTVVSTLLAIWATDAERLAADRLEQVEGERDRAVRAEELAQTRLGQVNAVKDFLQNKLLRQADVSVQANALLQAGGRTAQAKANPTILELLDRAAHELTEENIESNFPGQPQVQAEILGTVGDAYAGIGEYDRAIEFFRRVRALREQLGGLDHADTLLVMHKLAIVYRLAGKLDMAIALYERTLTLREAKLGADHLDTLRTMNELAIAYMAAGEVERSLALFEQAYERRVELRKGEPGPDDPDSLTAIINLELAHKAAGKRGLSVKLFKQLFEQFEATLGPDHPRTLRQMGFLAVAYQDAGRLREALPLFERAFKGLKATLGEDHPDTLNSLNDLALACGQAGQTDRSLRLFLEAYTLRGKKLGRGHLDTLRSMNNLVAAYKDAGLLDKALPLAEEALGLCEAKLGPDHPDTLYIISEVAWLYWKTGKPEQALPLYRTVAAGLERVYGPDHRDTLMTRFNLAVHLRDAGHPDQALPLLNEIFERREATLGPNHLDTINTLYTLAMTYVALGKIDDALPLLEQTVEREQERLGPKDPQTLTDMYTLVTAYIASGRLDHGLRLFEQWKARLGAEHPDTFKFMNGIASLLAQQSLTLLEQGQFAEAEVRCRECLSIREKTMPDDWLLFNTRSMLGGALLGQQKYAEAEPLLLAGYEGMKQREQTIQAPGKDRLTEALERLVTLYESRNGPDDAPKAAQYRKLLDERKAELQTAEAIPNTND